MKLNKKLKWTLGLASMAALTIIPMSVALVGCSKGDGNKLIVDENGIIQPLSKKNITPTQFNFDNSLNGTPIEVNSLEEANQMLEDKWNKLSNDEKIAYIKNDIQNWLNFINYNHYGAGPFSDYQEGVISTWRFSDCAVWQYNYRQWYQTKLKNIELIGQKINLTFETNTISQGKFDNSPKVDGQKSIVYENNYSNINIKPLIISYKNQLFSTLCFIPSSEATLQNQISSYSYWIINESLNGFTSADKSNVENKVGTKDEQILSYYWNVPSPSLNMLFNIKYN